MTGGTSDRWSQNKTRDTSTPDSFLGSLILHLIFHLCKRFMKAIPKLSLLWNRCKARYRQMRNDSKEPRDCESDRFKDARRTRFGFSLLQDSLSPEWAAMRVPAFRRSRQTCTPLSARWGWQRPPTRRKPQGSWLRSPKTSVSPAASIPSNQMSHFLPAVRESLLWIAVQVTAAGWSQVGFWGPKDGGPEPFRAARHLITWSAVPKRVTASRETASAPPACHERARPEISEMKRANLIVASCGGRPPAKAMSWAASRRHCQGNTLASRGQPFHVTEHLRSCLYVTFPASL